MKRLFALAALAIILAGCVPAATAFAPMRTAAPQVAPYPSCAIYGDSLAAGYDLLVGQPAFPADTAALLRAETPAGNCARLTVDATGGFTAANELASLQSRSVGYTTASLVVIEYGSNEFNRASATPAQTTRDLEALLAYLTPPTGRLDTLVCLGPWDTGSNALGSVADYDAAIFAGCAGRALHVADVDLSALYAIAGYHGGICCGDNYHPNPIGNAAIAQAIEEAL